MQYLTGWATAFGLLFTASLFIINWVSPAQNDERVKLHCSVGLLLIVTTGAHIMLAPFEGFSNLGIWVGAGLIGLTVLTGAILNYLPQTRGLRFHARSVHPALIIAIGTTVIHHILQMM